MQLHKTLKVVAVLEALKGILVLLAASGLLLFLHKDLYNLALELVEHAHLNPAAHYPSVFLLAAENLQNTKLTLIALGAAGYATLRFVEAYGLYHETSWAEVFAALSGGIYVPFEIAELFHRVSWIGIAALIINLVVVGVMVLALLDRRARTRESATD